MSLSHMRRDEAKHHLRTQWLGIIAPYTPSITDAFTDGFWEGRLWAAAKLIALAPELRDQVIEALELHENEVARACL